MTGGTHDLEDQLNKAIVEYSRRIEQGESIGRNEFLRRDPSIADGLRAYFENLDFAQSLAADAKSPSTRDTEIVRDTNRGPHSVQRPDGLSDAHRHGKTPFGPYLIKDVLGKGGMGVVYLATERKLNRNVALKIPILAHDETGVARKRFLREAQVVANLDHPNICPIYHFGDVDGVDYICMPVVTGQSLARILRGPKQLNSKFVAELIHKIASALATAHEAGILHRDLKPANVMLGKDKEPVVLDFGLASPPPNPNSENLTQTGTVAGTISYMAPEQLFYAVGNIGPATDVYALGLIFYELLTGKAPFPNGAVGGVAESADSVFRVPSDLRSGIDPRMDDLCRHMLMRDPKQRCPDMLQVAARLKKVLDGTSRVRKASQRSSADRQVSRKSGNQNEPPETATLILPPRKKRHRKASPGKKSIRLTPGLVGGVGVVLALAAFFGLWAAGIIFNFEAGDGTLVVKVNDEKFTTSSHGKSVRIINTQTGDGYKIDLDDPRNLQPRPYRFVVETNSGFKTTTDHFTISSGTQKSVEVWWEPAAETELLLGPAEPLVAVYEWPADAPPPAIAPFDEAQAKQHQLAWSEYLRMPVEKEVEFAGGTKMVFMLIPPGEFMMGAGNEEQAPFMTKAKAAGEELAAARILTEGPEHHVRISRPYYLGKYEVTQVQWEALLGGDVTEFKDQPALPVEQPDWNAISAAAGPAERIVCPERNAVHTSDRSAMGVCLSCGHDDVLAQRQH